MKRCIAVVLILVLALLCLPALAEGPEMEVPGLSYTGTLPLRFAEQFRVDYFEGGYKLISVADGNRYLVVPEGGEAPKGLSGVRILQQPLDHIYLAATSAMALFNAVDALDSITLSGTHAEGWYIEAAARAMADGRMQYAGKYSEPDYELLLSSGCDLAVESTMILHTPQVQEMIEQLGIPVFIDRASYEDHPLGRTEWVKLYAALVNREEVDAAFFDEQAAGVDALSDFPNTERTVAFFYIASDGSVNVRSTTDYVPVMIELAGGRYAFRESLPSEDNRSTVRMSMEEFYSVAVDADYLIYNGNIDECPEDIDDLVARSALLADFKAVKEGHVFTADSYLYQATDIVAQLVVDINRMLLGKTEGMTFLKHIG